MNVKLSTFGETSTLLESLQEPTRTPEQQPEPVVIPDNPASNPDTAEPTPEPEVPENESAFKLNFDEPTPTPDEQPQQPASAAPATNWKDAIKNVDKTELFKELGVSDFALEINEHIARGGNAADYLSAKSIDYNNVSDEDLLKTSLREQFPNFTKEEINRLFNRKYGTSDTMEDEEKEDKLLELKADAHIKRTAKIQEQQKFKIPEQVTPQVKDEAYAQWKQLKESQPQMMEQLVSFYNNHEATKSLNESKRVAISLGENVPPFHFNIDQPEMITKALTDDGTIVRRLTTTQSGEPDVAKQQLIMLFSHNPQKFIQDIFNYGQSRGVRKELVEDGQNAQRPQSKVLPMGTSDKPVATGVGKFGDRQR